MELAGEVNVTMNVTTSSAPVEVKLTSEGYYVSAFFLFIIGVFGMIANFAVFVVMAVNEQVRCQAVLSFLSDKAGCDVEILKFFKVFCEESH